MRAREVMRSGASVIGGDGAREAGRESGGGAPTPPNPPNPPAPTPKPASARSSEALLLRALALNPPVWLLRL